MHGSDLDLFEFNASVICIDHNAKDTIKGIHAAVFVRYVKNVTQNITILTWH